MMILLALLLMSVSVFLRAQELDIIVVKFPSGVGSKPKWAAEKLFLTRFRPCPR